MKFLIAILLIAISTVARSGSYMLLPIIEVYDGDTIKTNLTWRLPSPLNVVSIRISNIDTPESPAKSYPVTGKLGRAKCTKEAELALAAKARVIELVANSKRMKVSNFKWDKYGGRIDADVSVGGVNIAKTLIDEGLAVEYHGTGPKRDWCQ